MTAFQIKEANRLFWMVKGHLIPESWSEKDIESIYHSYIKRLWGNIEAYRNEVGFEQAWAARQAKKFKKN